MLHALSVDVEDWFHPEAVREYVPAATDELEARAEGVVQRLLPVLDAAGVRATFFVLGAVAERAPRLVEQLAAAGHEIASHGYGHRMITQQTPAEFAADLRRSLALLRMQSGQAVIGYRAPSFSVVADTRWALDILLDHGVEYDSSIFPVHHDRYGIPGAPRRPHVVQRSGGRVLWELPPVTLRMLGRTLPAAGGGYLRLLPYAWSALALRRMEAEGLPGVVYTHPWEYDVEQPRLPLPRLRALRHYGGIAGTEFKLARLMREFRFGTCAEVLGISRKVPPDAAPVPVAAQPVTSVLEAS